MSSRQAKNHLKWSSLSHWLFSPMAIFWVALFGVSHASAEMIIAEKTIDEGIHFVFEGGVKDTVMPEMLHLPEAQTDVHIEVLANWAKEDIPEGAPAGGFIPYLTITAEVRNEKTGRATNADLIPHVNLADNFHYARNISLPGAITDPYTAIFHIHPPSPFDLSFHKRWKAKYVKNNRLFEPQEFVFKNLNFEKIAKSTRD